MDNQTLDGLALRGLNSIFNSYGYYGYRRSEKKERVKSLLERPELFSYFDTLEYEMTLTGIADILKELSEQNDEEYEIPEYWRSRFVSFSSQDVISENIHSLLRDEARHIRFGISLNPNFDYFKYFQTLHSGVSGRGYIPQVYSEAVNGLCESNPLSFKIFADTELFGKKPSRGLKPVFRGLLYSRYISSGFLTEKTARKMRSESSYEASCEAVKALLASEEKYDNYNDLILQFTDSRHEYVLGELARELPVWMLSSLMGTESQWVKNILESRMS